MYDKLIKWIIIAFAILVALFKVRQSGKQSEINKQTNEDLKGARESAKIENAVDSADDSEYKRLYKKWSR